MPHPRFRPVLLLIVLLPLLMAVAGLLLWNSLEPQAPAAVASTPASALDSLLAYEVELADSPAPETLPRTLALRDLLIYIALLTGSIALVGHYLRSWLALIAVFGLPLAWSIWVVRAVGIPLLAFYLASVVFAGLVALLLRFVFYSPPVMRFRLPLSSLLGAGFLTLYYRLFFLIFGQAFPPGEWTQTFVNSLVLFVFVFFGMVIADLIIGRGSLKAAILNEPEDGASQDVD